MQSFDYVIRDEVGIDANPAVYLGKLAKEHRGSIVTLKNGDRQAPVNMLMGIVELGIKCGDRITLTVEGGDEEATRVAFEEFFKENL